MHNILRRAYLALVLLIFIPSLGRGGTLELGIPVKKLDNTGVWVVRWTDGGASECQQEYLERRLCFYSGMLWAHAQIDDSSSVNFLGVNAFAQFRAGPFWSRYGVGFGLFDKLTDKVRSRWDFNLHTQVGYMVNDDWGISIGWDHWSNGRSFAEKIGLVKYWPDYNDGGDSLLLTLVWSW